MKYPPSEKRYENSFHITSSGNNTQMWHGDDSILRTKNGESTFMAKCLTENSAKKSSL